MKQRKLILLILIIMLMAGCSGQPRKDSHPDWDKTWFRAGEKLASEGTEGFVLNESNDALSPAGLYYAAWTSGEGRNITNPQGQQAVVYEAQIYLLLEETGSASKAGADIDKWMKREAESYETDDEKAVNVNGQSFRILPLLSAKSENPFDHGMAAFGVIGSDAVTVELLCTADYDGDPETVLMRFLNGLHY